MCVQDPLLLENIVTGEETWCYQFDPELNRQSMAWYSQTSRDKKKRERESRLQESNVKTLLIVFFDNKRIIRKEFVPAGQTINAAFYQAVLNRFLHRIRRFRPELHRTGICMLLHDNAPAHSAIRVRQLLAQKMVTVLDQPPYSPDLVLADFFLFPRLKATIKVARFADVNVFQRSFDNRSEIDSTGVYADCFRKLYERCQTVL